MTPTGGNSTEVKTAQFVAAVITMTNFVYVLVGVLIARMQISVLDLPAEQTRMMGLAFIMAGAGAASVSFVVRSALAARVSPNGGTVSDRLRVTIVSLAIADVSGVLGLMHSFLAPGLTVPFILWGMSIGTGILLFPTRAWLEGNPGRQG